MFYRFAIAIALSTLSVTLFAQERIEIRRGGAGGLIVPFDGTTTVASSSGGSWLTRSTEGGVSITKGHNAKDGTFEIREDEDGVITVKMTREYGLDDAEKIMESHPELYMYLNAIPKEVGDAEIKIKLEITTTHKGDDADHLKEVDEHAHKLYQKYNGEGVEESGRFPMVFDRGRFRDLNIVLGADGAIEIVEDENEDLDEDSEEDSDEESDDDSN